MPTRPGLHDSLRFEGFEADERKIIIRLGQCFYVTNAWVSEFGSAKYKYLVLRPSYNIEHALPNAREILLLFSPYDNFEARTLRAYGRIEESYEENRINSHFRLLASKDRHIRQRLQQICTEEPDIPVTIPFTYDKLLKGDITTEIINATRESYFFRDLFAQRSPLQNHTYFFGRSALLASIRDRVSRGENSGVFGLRKSGKTSILLALGRSCDADGHRFTLVDCQNPSVTAGGWADVLERICVSLRQAAGLSITPSAIGDMSPDMAAVSFARHMNDVYSRGKRLSVIAFDEIEHISPDSGVEGWRNGENTRNLWQTLRSYQQSQPGKVAFVIAGTNPQMTEMRKIAGADNPLLEYINPDYLGGLSDTEVQHMCTTIGELMGMDFEVAAISQLYEDLGGHPYLTRQVCSHMHRNLPLQGRPTRITRNKVKEAVRAFDFSPLIDDILSSLRERYPDEYTCLEWIAQGRSDEVTYFLEADPLFLKHLQGYGIIRFEGERVQSRLGLVLDHLRRKARPGALNVRPDERWSAISAERGRVEVKLRSAVRNRIVDQVGKVDAREMLIAHMSKSRASQIASCSFDEIFSEFDCKLYFSDLMTIMERDSEYWSKRLGSSAEDWRLKMQIINDLRKDAHAKQMTEEEFERTLGAVRWFEEAL